MESLPPPVWKPSSDKIRESRTLTSNFSCTCKMWLGQNTITANLRSVWVREFGSMWEGSELPYPHTHFPTHSHTSFSTHYLAPPMSHIPKPAQREKRAAQPSNRLRRACRLPNRQQRAERLANPNTETRNLNTETYSPALAAEIR